MQQKIFMYLGLIIFGAVFFAKFQLSLLYPFFLISMFAGFHLLEIERIFRALTKHDADYVKAHLSEVASRQNQPLLSTSLLFLLYVPLLLFVLTSTGSAMGMGFMLGLGFRYLTEFILLQNTPDLLINTYLPTFKKELKPIHVTGITVMLAVVLVLITINFIL